MKPRVAINGFGRIGRSVLRINLESDQLDIVAINDPNPNLTMTHLLKYDSNYGKINAEVTFENEDEMLLNGKTIKTFHTREPAELPWADLDVDIVLECTGAFRTREGASKHLQSGAKRVLLSAPGKDEIDRTIVLGVNEKDLHAEKDLIISNASCTTNCLAPLAKVLNDSFGIEKGFMTTIHSYTSSQRVLDVSHKDLRRARAAAISMIPTTTGAAKAVGLVIPELQGKLNGLAIRVPTPTVSLVDLVCVMNKETTVEEVNETLKRASMAEMKGYLMVCDEPCVSVDFKGHPISSIVDGLSTMANGNLVKILSWYDNEWGYSERLAELAAYIWKQVTSQNQ